MTLVGDLKYTTKLPFESQKGSGKQVCKAILLCHKYELLSHIVNTFCFCQIFMRESNVSFISFLSGFHTILYLPVSK